MQHPLSSYPKKAWIPLSLDLTKAASTRALDAFDLSTGGLEGIVRILRRDAGRQAMHLRPGDG